MPPKTFEEWDAQLATSHAEQVANGLHDEACEWELKFYICHCRKRRREATGLVTPPTDELEFPPPNCTHCYRELWHDGDVWQCDQCHLSWDSSGQGGATFTDDYGDLSRCEPHGRRGCWHCEQARNEARAARAKAARDA